MSTKVQDLFDLSGQVALVTGGSRGLGLQIAEALGEAGARILLTSRKAGDLEEAVAHLHGRGIDASWNAADASDPEQVRRVCRETLERLGPVDILVNNAGAAWGAPAEDHPIDAWDKVMDLNVRGVFVFSQAIAQASMIPRRRGRIINVASIAGLGGLPPGLETIAYCASKGAVICTKAVWDRMREQRYGRIVMTTSSSGLYGNFGQANYGAAKMALVGLMQTLAIEGAKYDIRVNGLAPSAATSMTQGVLPDASLEALPPALVSPALLALVSEDAPTRTIVCAGGGHFACANVTLTRGVQIGGDDAGEQVIARWPEIADRDGELVPAYGFVQAEREVASATAKR